MVDPYYGSRVRFDETDRRQSSERERCHSTRQLGAIAMTEACQGRPLMHCINRLLIINSALLISCLVPPTPRAVSRDTTFFHLRKVPPITLGLMGNRSGHFPVSTDGLAHISIPLPSSHIVAAHSPALYKLPTSLAQEKSRYSQNGSHNHSQRREEDPGLRMGEHAWGIRCQQLCFGFTAWYPAYRHRSGPHSPSLSSSHTPR